MIPVAIEPTPYSPLTDDVSDGRPGLAFMVCTEAVSLTSPLPNLLLPRLYTRQAEAKAVRSKNHGRADMRAVTFDEAPVNHRDDGGAIGRVIVRDYFSKGHQLTPGPQAYLGQQLDPGSELFAHFHDVDQFQVVVLGDGRFGATPVAPITIQYADAYAPYGPIVANDHGIGFFVFRRRAASGGWRMPEYANLIPGKIGRRFFVDVEDAHRRPGARKVQRETL